jgi:hypothetical protein
MTGVFFYDITEVKITAEGSAKGGSLVLRVKTKDITGGTALSSWVYLETYDVEVFDHFRDIERLTTGPIGSLHTEPATEPTP